MLPMSANPTREAGDSGASEAGTLRFPQPPRDPKNGDDRGGLFSDWEDGGLSDDEWTNVDFTVEVRQPTRHKQLADEDSLLVTAECSATAACVAAVLGDGAPDDDEGGKGNRERALGAARARDALTGNNPFDRPAAASLSGGGDDFLDDLEEKAEKPPTPPARKAPKAPKGRPRLSRTEQKQRRKQRRGGAPPPSYAAAVAPPKKRADAEANTLAARIEAEMSAKVQAELSVAKVGTNGGAGRREKRLEQKRRDCAAMAAAAAATAGGGGGGFVAAMDAAIPSELNATPTLKATPSPKKFKKAAKAVGGGGRRFADRAMDSALEHGSARTRKKKNKKPRKGHSNKGGDAKTRRGKFYADAADYGIGKRARWPARDAFMAGELQQQRQRERQAQAYANQLATLNAMDLYPAGDDEALARCVALLEKHRGDVARVVNDLIDAQGDPNDAYPQSPHEWRAASRRGGRRR